MRLLASIRTLLVAACFLHAASLQSQDIDFSSVLNAFESNNYQEVEQALSAIETTKMNRYDKATWLYYKAEYYNSTDKHDSAYQYILQSKEEFNNLNKRKDVMDCNMLLLEIVSNQNKLEINIQSIIDELTDYAIKQKDTTALRKVYYRLALKYLDLNNRKESIKYFNKILYFAKIQNRPEQFGSTYTDIGTVYNTVTPESPDSALFYYKKAVPILIKHKNNQVLSYNYFNQADTYSQLKKHYKAINYLLKADSIPLDKYRVKTKLIFYRKLADAYIKINDYKKATLYFQKQIALQDSINDTQQNIAISKIKEKYDNEKLRADNLLIETERVKNKSRFIIASFLLAFSIIIGLLVYSNRLRKHRLTEREKEIEQQKVANLLKEQELVAIDAMIEGQEKERQLIASDLHDDLGALMATLQLNFDNLNKHRNSQDSEMLFERTKTLIQEAYQKIRSMAHVKNSGVIAKQGLLKAITNNASKISELNNIEIEVREYGLENRLENSLELTIFRIVQELITNIVKHANATHAIIHFTNHKDSLNIMVEDDGIGFDTKKITKSKGLGIRSIEKRVEFLGGTITVESFKSKGTTIIIDIPLET